MGMNVNEEMGNERDKLKKNGNGVNEGFIKRKNVTYRLRTEAV